MESLEETYSVFEKHHKELFLFLIPQLWVFLCDRLNAKHSIILHFDKLLELNGFFFRLIIMKDLGLWLSIQSANNTLHWIIVKNVFHVIFPLFLCLIAHLFFVLSVYSLSLIYLSTMIYPAVDVPVIILISLSKCLLPHNWVVSSLYSFCQILQIIEYLILPIVTLMHFIIGRC